MDSKRARELIDTDKLRKQLVDVASQVKDGESVIVPVSYMYGDPMEFIIKRENNQISIEPNFSALSMAEQTLLEEPVRQVVDNVVKNSSKQEEAAKQVNEVIKNQSPVFNQPALDDVKKGSVTTFGLFSVGRKNPSELVDAPKLKK